MSIGSEITIQELNLNPYPIYRRLQKEAPVCFVAAVNRWFVTRYEDVMYVDTHPELFTARETGSLQTKVMGVTMLRLDGAAHARLRKVLEEPLRPKVVQQRWGEMLRQVANEFIDQFAHRGEADLVRDFADPFCARTLKFVIGLNQVADEDMIRWTRDLMDGTSNYSDDPAVWARAEQSGREIDEAIEEAIKRISREPDGSILSAMVHTKEVEGGPLTIDEMRANIKLVIGGGLNEPRDGIALTVWGLLTNLDQAEMVRKDPSLFSAATEEALRWVSPLAMYPREVAVDTTLAGVNLPKGARVAVLVGSANRDEQVYEQPDRFDLTRKKGKSLAFGMGHHYCLGAWLARYQIGNTALPALFSRLPNLRLNLDHPPAIRGWVFRGPLDLHVKWDV